jgi:hypothetical protein
MGDEIQDKDYDILRGRVTFSAKSKTALATLLFLSVFKGNEYVYLKIDTATEALLDSLIANSPSYEQAIFDADVLERIKQVVEEQSETQEDGSITHSCPFNIQISKDLKEKLPLDDILEKTRLAYPNERGSIEDVLMELNNLFDRRLLFIFISEASRFASSIVEFDYGSELYNDAKMHLKKVLPETVFTLFVNEGANLLPAVSVSTQLDENGENEITLTTFDD